MRVLGLFPHPNDETYAAAGRLAWCARQGAGTAPATDPFAGLCGTPRRWPPPTPARLPAVLAVYRERQS